jgi:hypothetical protein
MSTLASFGHSKFLFLFIFSAQKNVLVVEVSKVQNKELVFDLEINSTGGIIKVSMSGSLCVSTHYSCFHFQNISVISWWTVLLVEETRVPGEKY